MLSDLGNKVADTFGLVYQLAKELRPVYQQFGIDLLRTNGDQSYTLPLPATYVVNRQGMIVFDFVDADYTKRAEPADVIHALQTIGQTGYGDAS